MFFIKQVSNDLGITPQAIYKQKDDLVSKGFMFKNLNNDWEITAEGYNFLKERQINRMKQKNIKVNNEEEKDTESSAGISFNGLNETLTNFYETRIEELKKSYEEQLLEQKRQVEYFKSLYEEEKNERIRTNNQYQTFLIGTAEDNKRHWWQFWNRNEKNNKEID